jgi:hypothetical protein
MAQQETQEERKQTPTEWRKMWCRRIRYARYNGEGFIPSGFNRLGRKIEKSLREKKRNGKVKHNCYNCAHVNGKDVGCGAHRSPQIHPPCKGKLWKAGRPYRFWMD